MTKAGDLTTLLEFPYDPTTDTFPNGLSPQAALVQGTDGNYYGTTAGGGIFGHGAIFEMSPAGALLQSVAVSQSNGQPGDPRAPLIQASNGNFYGTSYQGAATQTVAQFSSSLRPEWSRFSIALPPTPVTRETAPTTGSSKAVMAITMARRNMAAPPSSARFSG